MNTVLTRAPKKIILSSIGTATPSVSTLLSESFQMPQELVLKLLYTAPSVLFESVEPELAEEVSSLLVKLGLEVEVVDSEKEIQFDKELFDVSISINEIEKLPVVIRQLSEFLGCSHKESLQLATQVPSVVLGGVSRSTANALAKRLEAEVIVSNPKKDLYTLQFEELDELGKKQLKQIFGTPITDSRLEDCDYQTTQKVWGRFQSNDAFKIINQSHQRFELVLESVKTHSKQNHILTEEIGMPEDIIPEVIKSLPVQLFDNIRHQEAEDKIKRYQEVGMICKKCPKEFKQSVLYISNISDQESVKKLLSSFFTATDIEWDTQSTHWKSPYPLPELIVNYLSYHLDHLECEFEIK